MQTVLYARVSTAEQTIAHQRAQADAAGFKLDRVIADEGVSGVATLLKDRPEGRRLFDILRAGDVLVVRWLDRLGRNYTDVTDTVRDFLRQGVIIRTVINNLTLDGSTSDPMQAAVRDALIGFLSATAQAQAEATRSAQAAGIAHAKATGYTYLGRKPTYDREKLEAVRDRLAMQESVSAIARALNLSRQAVHRIATDPAGAEASLVRWGQA